MITLTALVALLGLGCLIQRLWKCAAERAEKALRETGAANALPVRAR